MNDLKKHMCLYVLNSFSIKKNGSIFSKDFENETYFKVSKNKIYGAAFELNDFALKAFASETYENEYHSILFFNDKVIGLAYNSDHNLISIYNEKFDEMSVYQTCSLIQSVEIFKSLFISPKKIEISSNEYKIFCDYINYSFDILESNEKSRISK